MSTAVEKTTYSKNITYQIDENLQFIPSLEVQEVDTIKENVKLWKYQGETYCPYYFATHENCLWVIPATSEKQAKLQFHDDNRVSFIVTTDTELSHIFKLLGDI